MMHPAISELIFRIVHKPHKSEDSLAKSLPEEFGVYTGELVAAVALFVKSHLSYIFFYSSTYSFKSASKSTLQDNF